MEVIRSPLDQVMGAHPPSGLITGGWVVTSGWDIRDSPNHTPVTPWKINIEPENDGLEDDFPFPGCILRFHVNLQGCNFNMDTRFFLGHI